MFLRLFLWSLKRTAGDGLDLRRTVVLFLPLVLVVTNAIFTVLSIKLTHLHWTIKELLLCIILGIHMFLILYFFRIPFRLELTVLVKETDDFYFSM